MNCRGWLSTANRFVHFSTCNTYAHVSPCIALMLCNLIIHLCASYRKSVSVSILHAERRKWESERRMFIMHTYARITCRLNDSTKKIDANFWLFLLAISMSRFLVLIEYATVNLVHSLHIPQLSHEIYSTYIEYGWTWNDGVICRNAKFHQIFAYIFPCAPTYSFFPSSFVVYSFKSLKSGLSDLCFHVMSLFC